MEGQQLIVFDKRLVHRDDPNSSRRALAKHKARDTNKRVVMQLVKNNPGRTAGEYYWLYPGLTLTEIRRRLTDLKNDGQVTYGPTKKCPMARKACVTWTPVEG